MHMAAWTNDRRLTIAQAIICVLQLMHEYKYLDHTQWITLRGHMWMQSSSFRLKQQIIMKPVHYQSDQKHIKFVSSSQTPLISQIPTSNNCPTNTCHYNSTKQQLRQTYHKLFYTSGSRKVLHLTNLQRGWHGNCGSRRCGSASGMTCSPLNCCT